MVILMIILVLILPGTITSNPISLRIIIISTNMPNKRTTINSPNNF